MSLDDKLKTVLQQWDERGWSVSSGVEGATLAEIKQAFAEELGIDQILQDMVNLRATMQQDMIRLGLTPGDPKLMTGQEWYDRFVQALDDEFHQFSKPIGDEINVAYDALNVHKAAKKASGL